MALESLTFKAEVESVRKRLLAQEDTDCDGKITIGDRGPKVSSHSLLLRSRLPPI